jgi:hypothetical protein
VPDNLILRGRDIRTNSSALALGDVNLTAGGDFTLKREGSEAPVLLGTITTVRGTYDFQGRRFQVLRDGSITFRGDTPPDPALNVTAERVISGIVAHVTVGGTMREPSVTLSSQPPPDQTDILSPSCSTSRPTASTRAATNSVSARRIAGGFRLARRHAGARAERGRLRARSVGRPGRGADGDVGHQVSEKLPSSSASFSARDVTVNLEYQLTNFLRLRLLRGQTSAERNLTRRVERAGIDVVYFSYQAVRPPAKATVVRRMAAKDRPYIIRDPADIAGRAARG